MSESRTEIFDWARQGHLSSDALPAALRIAGVTPGRADWHRFLDRLALWMGVVFCALAVIFFFAYNWQAMGRYAKFGLVELLIVLAIALGWRLGLERAAGKATLLAATLLAGALLALVGQTYQTGADTFELFAVWALAVFPWVAIACFGPLWLLWIGLLNLAMVFYWQVFGGWLGMLFSPRELVWTLFALNTIALCVWEAGAQLGVAWLRERWSPRVLAVASGGSISALAVWSIMRPEEGGIGAMLAYLAWIGAAWGVYRYWLRDLFVLAGGALSVIVVITVYLSKHLLRFDGGASYLLIGLLIIGLSAVSGLWLKSVAAEERG
jgi:uncharacterized membrane protein